MSEELEYPTARTRAVGFLLERSQYPKWGLQSILHELAGNEPELYELLQFLARHWQTQQRPL